VPISALQAEMFTEGSTAEQLQAESNTKRPMKNDQTTDTVVTRSCSRPCGRAGGEGGPLVGDSPAGDRTDGFGFAPHHCSGVCPGILILRQNAVCGSGGSNEMRRTATPRAACLAKPGDRCRMASAPRSGRAGSRRDRAATSHPISRQRCKATRDQNKVEDAVHFAPNAKPGQAFPIKEVALMNTSPRT